jgi:hypothetical protein
MKNLFNIGFVVLILVVLGCNCQKFKELADEAKNSPSPTPNVSNTSSSPTSSSTPTSTSSSKSGLSMAKYDQIKDGMSYKEVTDIIGKEGTEQSSSKVGSTVIKTMKWQGDDYEFIFVNFTNDKVTFKSQANLK